MWTCETCSWWRMGSELVCQFPDKVAIPGSQDCWTPLGVCFPWCEETLEGELLGAPFEVGERKAGV